MNSDAEFDIVCGITLKSKIVSNMCRVASHFIGECKFSRSTEQANSSRSKHESRPQMANTDHLYYFYKGFWL